jgi:hypothetical protein
MYFIYVQKNLKKCLYNSFSFTLKYLGREAFLYSGVGTNKIPLFTIHQAMSQVTYIMFLLT